jgi:uncharacterized protein YcsI (UPF0317 family)
MGIAFLLFPFFQKGGKEDTTVPLFWCKGVSPLPAINQSKPEGKRMGKKTNYGLLV